MSYQRLSQAFAPTLKEDPVEAQIPSHRLLLRAGMIRKTASGLYSYLPFAWKALLKIEQIIREELNAIGEQEMLVPHLTPAELWVKTGRWGVYGPELMRLKDRHDREFALGPTHEETFTDLVTDELRSYKQLPVTLWQIQDKFRDELRPRFGLMRGREFIMKDAYSFCADQESLQKCYDDNKVAYDRIFKRCGLFCLPVIADSGQIGGDVSVEFMALADSGEAALSWCDCGFAADTEAATATITVEDKEAPELSKVETPNCRSIEEVAKFLKVSQSSCRKSIALKAEDGSYVLVLLPGDHELNECKAEHLFGNYSMMEDEDLNACGLVEGFMGPVGLGDNIKVYADSSLKDSQYWIIGANEEGYHYVGAQVGRDFTIDVWADLAEVKEGDGCPCCSKPLKVARGIEVGQVFQLGTKYSEAMNATFMDVNGKEQPFVMGCYGIGVSRTLAAIVEQCHDEDGITWPVSVSPFDVEILSLDVKDELTVTTANKLTSELSARGLDVLVDDRSERPGIKFKDADLYGFPYQLILGKRGLSKGVCELKNRLTGDKQEIELDSVVEALVKEISEAKAQYNI